MIPMEKNPPPAENDSSNHENGSSNVEFPEEMDLPEDFTPLVRPDDLSSSSRARRRRARRTLIPPGDDDRGSLLEDLSRRSFPPAEFFLFALLSGILIGAGYLLDSHALILLGLLVAPLLTPWVGASLAVATGGWRFFFLTLSSLVVIFLLSFLASALIGLLNKLGVFSRFFIAADHAKLWWTDIFLVTLGAVLLVITMVRGERKPILPSLMLAYGLFLPLGAAGFALGAGLPEIWPDGILIFLTYFSLATIVGVIVLRIQRFKPRKAWGYTLLVIISLVCMVALVAFTGLADCFFSRAFPEDSFYTPTSLGLVSPTPGLPPSPTLGSPLKTSTSPPTGQPSSTPTLTSTPSFALIAASTGGGALVRSEPGGGTVLTTLINGTLVEVLPEIRSVGTVQWVHIRTLEGIEGWVLEAVLVNTTPAPPGMSTITISP